jgi:octaprenyl-diphosphate synthase
MTTTLEQIRRPVADELRRYEEYLHRALHSDGRLSSQMLAHVMGTRGKAVRPMLVILSAAIWGHAEKGYLPAMLAEMFHTATLVHDDVIDHSPCRRGQPSADALWDSRRAVLLGDLILAKSFGAGMSSGRYEAVEYITRCMTALCEGELLQSEIADEPHRMTRDIYNEIIYNKTATLIGTCCGVGAMVAGAGPEMVETFKRIGDDAGMAFQIKDDILDFADGTGKPRCGDLREGKVTLPLLTVIEKSTPQRRVEIIEMLGRGDVDALCGVVEQGGGLEMAAAEMERYVARAADGLRAACPPSPYRDSLEELFRFIAYREK